MIGKYQSAGGCFEYISVRDPALDLKHKDFDLGLYIETRDKKHRPVLDGATPTVFHLRPLTLLQWEAVTSLPKHVQDKAAIQFSLDRVDNYRAANGEMLRCVHVGEGDERRCDSDTMKALFAPDLFSELGTVIVRITSLDPLSGRR
jgi:hypothetical protein